MAMAQEKVATPLVLGTRWVNNSRRVGQGWKLRQRSFALLQRFWWHTKAYVPILGILVLALGSLVLLWLHGVLRNRGKQFTHFAGLNKK